MITHVEASNLMNILTRKALNHTVWRSTQSTAIYFMRKGRVLPLDSEALNLDPALTIIADVKFNIDEQFAYDPLYELPEENTYYMHMLYLAGPDPKNEHTYCQNIFKTHLENTRGDIDALGIIMPVVYNLYTDKEVSTTTDDDIRLNPESLNAYISQYWLKQNPKMMAAISPYVDREGKSKPCPDFKWEWYRNIAFGYGCFHEPGHKFRSLISDPYIPWR